MNTIIYKIQLVVLLFCSTKNVYSQSIFFNYFDDSQRETLDSTSTGLHPWYLDIQNQFVHFYNTSNNRKYLIDPNTLCGVYWNPHYFMDKKLLYFEIPGKIRYCVNVASQGVGFEGYFIVSFIRISRGRLDIDASYGSFANNSERDYSSAFYKAKTNNRDFEDSILWADMNLLPMEFFEEEFTTQYVSQDSLQKIRKYNTLFFGVAPHDLVRKSLLNEGSNLFIEMSAEEYQHRLLNIKNKFKDNLRMVDRAYLYTDYQQDWRYLISNCTYTENTILTDRNYTLIIDTKSYPKNVNDYLTEQYLFPNIEIQKAILNSSEINMATGISLPKRLTTDYKNDRRFYKEFNISKKNCISVKDIGIDSAKIIFDTTRFCQREQINKKTVLGTDLTPIYYIGKVKNSRANGKGTLYLATDCGDTSKYGYFTLSGDFKKGLPTGKFVYRYHDFKSGIVFGTIAEGEVSKGKLNGEILKFDAGGNKKSESYYVNGGLVTKKIVVYHNYDNLFFLNHLPKISDSYTAWVDGKLMGIEIPSDTAFHDDNSAVFINNNEIYLQLDDQRLEIPFNRDYDLKKLSPSGQVYVFYNDGSKLISNWDNKYIIGGSSIYYWPKYGGWFPTTVSQGLYTVTVHFQVEEKHSSHGIFGAATNFVKSLVSAPINAVSATVNFLQGNTNISDYGIQLASNLESTIGSKLALEGNVVHIVSESGTKMIDFAYPDIKLIADYDMALSPVSSEIKIVALANKKFGINDNAIDRLNKFTSFIPNIRDKVVHTVTSALFNTANIASLVEAKFGTYLALASGGFPQPINNPYPHPIIPNPTFNAEISSLLLQKIFDKTFDHAISLDNSVIKSISINGSKIISYDNVLNSINVSFTNGAINVQEGSIKNTFTLKECRIEFLPLINFKDNHFYLELYGIVTYLDLQDAIPIVNKMIAWALQTEFLNNKEIGDIDISNLLSRDISVNIKGQKNIATNEFKQQYYNGKIRLQNFSWYLKNNKLVLSAEERVDESSNIISNAETSNSTELPEEIKLLNCSSFPTIKQIPINPDINEPDFLIGLGNSFMKLFISRLFSKPIEFPFSDNPNEKMSNHYAVIRKINNISFYDKNIINLSISGEVWFRTKTLKLKMTINELNLVTVPLIIKKDTSFFIFFATQIKYLDIKNLPTFIDKCIANYLDDKGYFNFDPINITNFLAFKIENPIEHSGNVAPKVSNANLISNDRFYNILLKCE